MAFYLGVYGIEKYKHLFSKRSHLGGGFENSVEKEFILKMFQKLDAPIFDPNLSFAYPSEFTPRFMTIET